MIVDCFKRDERNGLHVLMPLDGRMKHDCMIVNDSVKFVHGLLSEGLPIDQVATRYQERAEELAAQEPPPDPVAEARAGSGNGSAEVGASAGPNGGRVTPDPPPGPTPQEQRFDLYRILVMLQDHDLCDYPDSELMNLLPQGKELKGSSQILPICAVPKTSEFLKRSIVGEAVKPFFSMPHYAKLDPNYFELGPLSRRHLTQEQVHFVQLDAKGEVRSCVLVGGLIYQPQTLRITFAAAAHPSEEEFVEAIGSHVASICGLLSVVTLSAAIRFEYATGDDSDVYLHDRFVDVLGELGFRRAFDLPDEMGQRSGVVGYDKALF